ncbi:MAG: autotransporter domain-containing protein [Phascolarctobacterium sp.]|nr:autotransporter domain-containing protein [Phascolarctobacterium sp.]
MFKNHRRLTAAVLLSCSCLLAPYYAYASEEIEDQEEGKPVGPHATYNLELSVNGKNFANFEVYDKTTDTEQKGYYTGEGYQTANFREFFTTETHTTNEKDAIATSMKYLVDMVGTPAATLNMNLKLFEPADANASAMSNTWIQLDENGKPITQISDSALTATYLGKKPFDSEEGIAEITINDANNWYTAKFPVLPSNGTDSDYYGTITHEMFHAMGLGTYIRKSEIEVQQDDDEIVKRDAYFFGTDPSENTEDSQERYNNTITLTNANSGVSESEDTTIVFNKYEMGLRDAFGRVAYYEDQNGTPVYYDGGDGEKKPINPNAANPMEGVIGKLVSREIVNISLEKYNDPDFVPEANKFYVIQDSTNKPMTNGGAYFTGAHVQEVLNGATIAWPDANANSPKPVPGLPINGYHRFSDEYPELSHIELQNSMMSHQSYRNWCTYMEAEIALLQDLGYTIDRSKYFGKSIYNSGTEDKYFSYTNNTSFDSTQMHGIGLHVYGSYVDVTQAADIKADGDYGIGIRVDGVGNKVTIDSNVSANGEGGNGLLVAYGKNHNITLNAGKTIEATGKDGVAARFDFGSNELGDTAEYRGSYILTKYTSKEDIDEMIEENKDYKEYILASKKIGWSPITEDSLIDDINGALVTDFNVAGTLKGEKAAIYISENALVQNINIMNGASLQGDIISKWNPKGIIYDNPPAPEEEENNNNDQGAVLSTTGEENIPVGGDRAGVGNEPTNPSEEYQYQYEHEHLQPTTGATIDLGFGANVVDGVRTGSDSEFKMTYNGNIKGENGLYMHIMGGNLEYNGTAEVLGVIIEGDNTLQTSGATLSGKGTYILTANENGTRGTFSNKGTFDLGEGITTINIKGNYVQDYYGNLLVDFNTDNKSDKLNITEGTANLDGKITLTPQVDYYYNGQKITIDVVDAPSITNNIKNEYGLEKVIFNNISPVLNFSLNETETTNTLLGEGKYVINVERVEQGYQSVATDDISSSIGSAIDIGSQKTKDEPQYIRLDKEALLSAIDFPLTITDSDAERKKVVSNNLKKLNPNVVGSQAQAVIETHTTLNNLVSTVSSLNVGSMSMNTPVSRRIGGLGPNRVEPPKYNSWRNIVIPFSSYTDQHNGSNGYTNHNSGVIGATERTFANGLTHGYHAALNHQSTEDSGSTIKGEGIYFGTHASYAPADWNGWSVFGSARLGVEQMRSHRRVYISDSLRPYMGTADGDWTGYSGSFNVGAALTKEHGAVKSGPFAALDYSFAHRPSVHEDGGAVRTNLESTTYDSLRTQLGYRLVTNPKPLHSYDSTKWQAHASVAWNHELLSDNGRTNYQLADFPGATIEDDVETYGRDSMSVAAGIIFKTPNRLDVGLTLGSDIYRKGGSSIYGKVNFEWKF